MAGMGLVLTLVWTLVLSLGFAQTVRADEGDGGSQPGRAVRLSSVNGQVQVSQGGQMLEDHAIANTPLFEGTQLTTGSDGRAEVQFEDGSVARIPPASSLTLSVLRPDGNTEILLSGGMGYFELQGGSQGSPMRVRFGGNGLTASGFTVLRVKLDDGPPNVAVFSGNAHLEGPGGLVADLHGGESIALNGGGAADSNVAESIEPDSWDAWNADRDQALTASETGSTDATKNLPQSNNPAWGDLNTNGTWYNTGDQGYVWSPYEAANSGWDPYGTGNWVFTPGYGYVWASGESWGYMPYQCGAWNYYDAFGWGWAPGGCNTWWGGSGYGYGGGGGWYFTIGIAPKWYRLPVRPGPPKPFNPHPVDRAHAVGPAPIVPVNRRLPMEGVVLPPRDKSTPVTIGGTVAAPLRPEPVRPVYGHQPQPVNGMRNVIGAPPENTRTPQVQPNWPAVRPSPQPAPFSRPAPPPSRPSYSGGGGYNSPPPAPSHSSPPPPASGHPK
jgi:hypothetical protein